jgi:hypothetical protein
MTKILLFLLFIFFVIPFLLRSIVRFLFGSQTQSQQKNFSGQKGSNNRASSANTQQTQKKKKVISQDEGEYVDFVEIKE